MQKYRIKKRTKSGGTKFVDTIYFEPRDAKSYASAVLLKDYYEQRDTDFVGTIEYRMRRIAFSRNFLKAELKKKGKLCCTYCKNPHLKIEWENMVVPQDSKATIDHVIPISNGGGVFDVRNIVVACGKCNSKKGSLSLQEFFSRYATWLEHRIERFSIKKPNAKLVLNTH